MRTFSTLFISAAIGVALAALGVAATMAALSPTAAEVAREMASEEDFDPAAPPAFYGTR
ncbi:hypothetical protein [Salinispora tropica]|uniref:hypothetical protein n=1 Tax=Salinispora tropica TaxID=168695 RepID=UPI000308D6CC|nr:hypothetical protein [Salinispora tropica]